MRVTTEPMGWVNKYSVACVCVCVSVCARCKCIDRSLCLLHHVNKQTVWKLSSFGVHSQKCDLFIVASKSSMFAILPDGLSFVNGLVLGHYLHSLLWVWRLLPVIESFKYLLISTMFLVTVHYSTNSLLLLIRFITQSFWYLTLFYFFFSFFFLVL